MPEYLEFKVLIQPSQDSDQIYSVSVDAGGRDFVSSTLNWKDLASLSVPPGPGTSDGPRAIGPRAEPKPRRPAPDYKGLGEQLGRALFQGAVSKAWDALKNRAQDNGIRIRLVMDLHKAGMARIAGLPWELLRLEDQGAMTIDYRTPLVRSLELKGTRPPPAPHDGPIRILVVISNPKGHEPLNLPEECEKLRETLSDSPHVEVQLKFLRAEGGVSLRKRLLTALEAAREKPYHVLHYMGHGGLLKETAPDRTTEVGVLVFENERGEPDLVSGEALADLLAGHLESFRLVVLNACDTAKAASGPEVSPLSSVATALIQRGVGAVVAMQQPISDTSALEFSEHFYERVAGPARAVDVAVADARKLLSTGRSGGSGNGEWAAPVIYLQPGDGVVFPAPEANVVTSDRVGGSDMPTVFLATPSLSLCDLHTRLRANLGKALQKHRVEYSDRRRAPDADTRAKIRSADLCVHLLSDTCAKEEPDAPGESAAVQELKAVRAMGRPHLVICPINANEQGEVSKRYKELLVKLAEAHRDEGEFELLKMDHNALSEAIRARVEGPSAAAASNARAGSSSGVRVDAFRTDLMAARKLEDVVVGQDLNVTRNTSVDGTPDPTCESIGVPLYIVVAGEAESSWVKERVAAAKKAQARPDGPRYVGVYKWNGKTHTLDAKSDNTDDDPSAEQLAKVRKGLS